MYTTLILFMKFKTPHIELFLLLLFILGTFLLRFNLYSKLFVLYPALLLAIYFFLLKIVFNSNYSKSFILSDIVLSLFITSILISLFVPNYNFVKILKLVTYLISIGFFIYFKDKNKERMYLHALIFSLPLIIPFT